MFDLTPEDQQRKLAANRRIKHLLSDPEASAALNEAAKSCCADWLATAVSDPALRDATCERAAGVQEFMDILRAIRDSADPAPVPED
jgi:hypothetical protein